MKYMVLETSKKDCVVLDEFGRFIKAVNKNYEVGQTIETISEISAKPIKFNFKRITAVAASIAACFVVVLALQAFNNADDLPPPFASVYLTINPEMRVDICEDKSVIGIVPLDADGETLVTRYGGEQDDFLAVTGEIVDHAVTVGFLRDGGSVTITIVSPNEIDETWLDNIQRSLTQIIYETLAGRITVAVEIRKDVGKSGLIMIGGFALEPAVTREPEPRDEPEPEQAEPTDYPGLQEARVFAPQRVRVDRIELDLLDVPKAEYEPIRELESGVAHEHTVFTPEIPPVVTPEPELEPEPEPEIPPERAPDRRPGGGGGGGTQQPPLECGCRGNCTCELACGCIGNCTCELACGCIGNCTCELACGCIGNCTCELACGCIGNCTCELACGCIGNCTCEQNGIAAHSNQTPIERNGEVFLNIDRISTVDSGIGESITPNSVVGVWHGDTLVGIITLGNPHSDAVIVLFEELEDYNLALNINWQSGSFYGSAVLNKAGIYVIPRLKTPGVYDNNALNQFGGMRVHGQISLGPLTRVLAETSDLDNYIDDLSYYPGDLKDYIDYLSCHTDTLKNYIDYFSCSPYDVGNCEELTGLKKVPKLKNEDESVPNDYIEHTNLNKIIDEGN